MHLVSLLASRASGAALLARPDPLGHLALLAHLDHLVLVLKAAARHGLRLLPSVSQVLPLDLPLAPALALDLDLALVLALLLSVGLLVLVLVVPLALLLVSIPLTLLLEHLL